MPKARILTEYLRLGDFALEVPNSPADVQPIHIPPFT